LITSGFSATVATITVSNDLLFVGYFSGSIVAWQISSGELFKKLDGKNVAKCS
jgi:hypothetical protein